MSISSSFFLPNESRFRPSFRSWPPSIPVSLALRGGGRGGAGVDVLNVEEPGTAVGGAALALGAAHQVVDVLLLGEALRLGVEAEHAGVAVLRRGGEVEWG